jgi:hypothetical protein
MSGANRIAGKGRLTPAKTARITFDGRQLPRCSPTASISPAARSSIIARAAS